MTAVSDGERRARIGAAAAALGLHAALALLLASLWTRPAVPDADADAAIALFTVAFDPPPPPLPAAVPPARSRAAPRPDAAAAPEGRRAEPVPLVAPPARVPIASAMAVAPLAGIGDHPAAGAAERGTASGAGGAGSGRGAGQAGDGGGGTRARLLRGAISDRDYPAAARRAGAMGSVTVSFTVGTNGRPGGCTVAISSGHASLDAATCRLIEARFRYAPAQDAAGEPIAEPRAWRQRWWFARRDE